MQLNAGQAESYRKRHDEIWPALAEALLGAGVIDFRIYLDDETNILFAHLVAAAANDLDRMRDQPVMWAWWTMMSDIMETNEDSSPREWELVPMFSLTADN